MAKKFIIIIFLILVWAGLALYVLLLRPPTEKKETKETEEKTWTTAKEEPDVIKLFSLQENEAIESPLVISGEARGFWFFEADFPVVLTNWDGLIIAQTIARAKGDWMTADYVPFEATLEFENPAFPEANEEHFSRRGHLILQKANPSGLPEHDDALEVPITFSMPQDATTSLPSEEVVCAERICQTQIKIEPEPKEEPPAPPPEEITAEVLPPEPQSYTFTLTADDNSASPSQFTVEAGSKVTLTFNVSSQNVYYGGLDFRSPVVNTGTILPEASKTITFLANSSFEFIPYWPASQVRKGYEVKIITQ